MVPKTGVSPGRSMECSTSTVGIWAAGLSHGTSMRGGVRSRGTAGRSSRRRSAPQPGMFAASARARGPGGVASMWMVAVVMRVSFRG